MYRSTRRADTEEAKTNIESTFYRHNAKEIRDGNEMKQQYYRWRTDFFFENGASRGPKIYIPKEASV